jgi:ABC-2 type transport system ATP-binding protein
MPIIHVEHLAKKYRSYQKEPGVMGSIKGIFKRKYIDVHAVKDVSFNIEEGELIGFIGPNGAGKTTTLKMLSGLIYPSAGTVSVLGNTPFDRREAFLKQISLVMGQKNQLWWDLPAYESFLLNKEIYEIPTAEFKSRVEELSELLEVTDVLNIQVRKLSLGQRMKCELIAALLHHPKILFLDEPTIGLDVVVQKKLREFIKNYNRKYKATILLTSHYMQDVEELCERIIVIDHGRILFDGKLATIIKKFSREKSLVVTFKEPVPHEKLERLGKVTEYDSQKAIITVPMNESNRVAAHLLQDFPVEDLNIVENDIEEIIRNLFTDRT